MSAVESALITLVQSNISWYFGQKSMFVDVAKSPIASLAVGEFAKIYSSAKQSGSLRFALDLTETTAAKILNISVVGNGFGKLRKGAEDPSYSFAVNELINVLCPQELRDAIEKDDYFYYGVRMMGGFITKNTPRCIQECEVVKLVNTAMQGPQGKQGTDDASCEHGGYKQSVIGIAHVLWETAQEKMASDTGVHAASKFLHATIENTQSVHKSVTAHFTSASSLFTTVTNSMADEAKNLAKMCTETSEQAVTTVAQAVKEAQHHIVSMEMTLTEFVKASVEGMELFSEYFWTSKPSRWDFAWDLPEANYAIIDDEDLQLLLMNVNQQDHRRRPIVHFGER